MKKTLLACFIAAAFVAGSSVFAADQAAKEVTLMGKGACAKCALHQTDTCQNTITVTEDGKDQVYYLAPNSVSEDFHDNLCRKSQPIKVTGTVQEVDGKKQITASKIELAKG